MQDMPVDLLKQIHPVYGGAIGFGFWVLIQCFRAWREYKKEQRPEQPPDPQEVARSARLNTGFAALDASRDNHIAALIRQIDALNKELDATVGRHGAEIIRLDARLAAKTELLAATEADRDRGWDLARDCHEDLRDTRHKANDLIMAAFAAGQRGLAMPAGLPPAQPLHSRTGKRPE